MKINNALQKFGYTTRRLVAVSMLGLLGAAGLAVPVQAAETITYYHLDALGSPVAATDEQGNVKWREEYKPYGERIKEEAGAQGNSRWYTGHPHDEATGLTYMGARYYDPVVGRFMATDPVAFTEKNVHSFNRYGYGNNNPYRFIDPNGMWVEDVVIGVPSVALGVDSLWDNAKAGNWRAATVDAVGIAVDAAAIAAPGVPGGMGLGIKASREVAESALKRGLWTISKEGTERVVKHDNFGKLYKSKSDGLWWAKDNAGHGESNWKVFRETSKGLEWYRDADKYGDFIVGKHKGDVGRLIPWKELNGSNF